MKLICACALFFGTIAFPFAEMVRHGYGNCVACHVSPSGTGLLNPYGRALSKEVLSRDGIDGESDFLYGLVPTPKPFIGGGDIRFLESAHLFENKIRQKFIPMQIDAEAGLDFSPVILVATAGLDYDMKFISRRHFVIYRPSENISFRAGHFLPIFGINTDNRSVGVKKGIAKDQGTESYNIEAGWISPDFDFFLTGIFRVPDDRRVEPESGISLSSSVFIQSRFKLGASYFYGEQPAGYHQVGGPFVILGLSEKVTILAELDYQEYRPRFGPLSSSASFLDQIKLDYEISKGIHIFGLQEFSLVDFKTPNATAYSYGLGVQYFPRPHFEFNLAYQRQRLGGPAATFSDFVFGVVHYYL